MAANRNKGIGNYIHARYNNYIKFGINKPSDKRASKSTWSVALNSERRRVGTLMREQENSEKNSGGTREIRKVERYLKSLLAFRNSDKDYRSYAERYIYETVQQIINEKHGDYINLDGRLGVHRPKYGTSNKKIIYQKTINNLYDEIQYFIKTGKPESMGKLKRIAESLKPFLQELKDGELGQSISLENNPNLTSVLAMAEESLGMPPKTIIGEAFEDFLGLASEVAKTFGINKALEVTEESFNKINLRQGAERKVVAKDEFSIGLHSGFFDSKILEKAIQQDNPNLKYTKKIDYSKRTDLMDDGSVYYDLNANSTQGKTDVNFEWPTETGNVMLKMSAKNYELGNKSQTIHILDGAPLLVLLQTENDNNFANHYINILAHSYKGRFSSGINVQGYHDVFKQIIFIKGLTGRGIQGREKAASDFLVVNVRNKDHDYQGISILRMSDLIEKARRSLKKIKFEGYPEDGDNVGNSWVAPNSPSYDAADQRISSVLNALYNYKIGVEVRQSFLFHA